MNNDKANKIVQELLQDKNLYQQKSLQEGEVWGRIFSSSKYSDFQKLDQEAAKELKFNRDILSPIALLRKHKIFPVHGLSLVSPFESIRSGEIIPIFLEKFEVIEKFEFNSILRLVMPLGARVEYLQNEESRAIFELLFLIDRMLVDKGILTPTAGQYLLKPKQ